MHPLLRQLSQALDPDRALQTTMTGLIEATAMQRALAFDGERWTPGNPLKLLLAGYVGTRNTTASSAAKAPCSSPSSRTRSPR